MLFGYHKGTDQAAYFPAAKPDKTLPPPAAAAPAGSGYPKPTGISSFIPQVLKGLVIKPASVADHNIFTVGDENIRLATEKSARFASHAPGPSSWYRANNKNVSLGICFKTESDKQKFLRRYKRQVHANGIAPEAQLKFADFNKPGVLYIEAAARHGGPGAYLAKNGETAINFVDVRVPGDTRNAVANNLCSALRLTNPEMGFRDGSAYYFHTALRVPGSHVDCLQPAGAVTAAAAAAASVGTATPGLRLKPGSILVSIVDERTIDLNFKQFPVTDTSLGAKARSITLIRPDMDISLFNEDDGGWIGIVMNPDELTLNHAEFDAYRSGSMVPDLARKEHTKYPEKKGRAFRAFETSAFATNYAQWNIGEMEGGKFSKKKWDDVPSFQNFEKALERKYFYKKNNQTGQYVKKVSAGEMDYNELLVQADKNPVVGLCFNMCAKDGLPFPGQVKKNKNALLNKAMAYMKANPALKLWIYQREVPGQRLKTLAGKEAVDFLKSQQV